MKNSLIHLAGAALLAFALTSAVKADPINGNIAFAGSFSLDAPIQTATTVTSFANTHVETSSGDFSSILVNTPVAFAPTWNFGSGGGQPALWSVSGFTFDLSSSSIIVQGLVGSNYWLVVEGTGIVSGNGYDATAGSWSFTSQSKSNVATSGFSFSAESSVPDGGTTALLVGFGLVSMSLLARRKRA